MGRARARQRPERTNNRREGTQRRSSLWLYSEAIIQRSPASTPHGPRNVAGSRRQNDDRRRIARTDFCRPLLTDKSVKKTKWYPHELEDTSKESFTLSLFQSSPPNSGRILQRHPGVASKKANTASEVPLRASGPERVCRSSTPGCRGSRSRPDEGVPQRDSANHPPAHQRVNSGIARRMNSSNSGTVNAISPWAGL